MKRSQTDKFFELKREYDNQETEWSSLKNHRTAKLVSEIKLLVESWYVGKERPDTISDIIEEYFSDAFRKKESLDLRMGYMYFAREVDKFLERPRKMLDFYVENKDIIDFSQEPFVKYTTDEKRNEKMFLTDMIYFFTYDNEFSMETLSALNEEQKNQIFGIIESKYTKYAKDAYMNEAKRLNIIKIKDIITKLSNLGTMNSNLKQHNAKMKTLGLEGLLIDENIPCIEDNKLFGIDLDECSLIQTEAMLCFYSNRIEKVRENVGLGLFILNEIEQEGKEFNEKIEEEDLKKYIKKYTVLDHIANNIFESVYKLQFDTDWTIDDNEIEAECDRILEEYKDAYIKLIYGKENMNLEEELEMNAIYSTEVTSYACRKYNISNT